MPVQKFRSGGRNARIRGGCEPGSLEHVQRVRAVLRPTKLLAGAFTARRLQVYFRQLKQPMPTARLGRAQRRVSGKRS